MMRALALALLLCSCTAPRWQVVETRRWVWEHDDGRRCFFRCRSRAHVCASQCGGRLTIASTGIYQPPVVGVSDGPAGCEARCTLAGEDCMHACQGLSLQVQARGRRCPEPDERRPGPGGSLYTRRGPPQSPCGPVPPELADLPRVD
jgi:hypothetical protein